MKDILDLARKRAKLAADADGENRRMALDDLTALSGDQWPTDIREAREDDGRPILTINRLPQFVRQVTGDIRNVNPAIVIHPSDSEADDDGAEIIEGIVRQIQYESEASSVYERAAESAAQCGMGYFRVLTDYVDDKTFDQKICIKTIHNPFSVYFDPEARMPTREDAKWAMVTEVMSKEAFEDAYPGKSHADVETSTGDGMEFWRVEGSVVVAEYFWIETTEAKIWLLPDGQAVEKVPEGLKTVRDRMVQRKKVMWAKISGVDVLEGPREFPADYIPVISVMGEEIDLGRKVYRSSVIRHAIDPQRLYNYWRSAQTEIIALQPKAPFLVTPKQVAGLETIWSEANTSNRSYLPFNPDEKNPGAPQRSTPPISSPGMTEEVLLAADDMKATTGVYDAALGNRSNEQSGRAIRARQLESDISTSIYVDNMSKAVAHCGRVIVSMLPRVYDTERRLMTMSKTDKQEPVIVNRAMLSEDGPVIENNLGVGRYDVRVAVGPNYSTARAETAESMMQFIQSFPAAAPIIGDIMAESMDWPKADVVADRLRKTLPPGLSEEEPDPAQAQAAQAQQQQMQQMQSIALREAEAKARKAEADAQKAEAEALKARAEMGVPLI